jgi:hypothetical protein
MQYTTVTIGSSGTIFPVPAEKTVDFKFAGPVSSVVALLQEIDLGYPDADHDLAGLMVQTTARLGADHIQGTVEVHFSLDSGSPDDAPITAKLTVLVVAT